MKAPLLLLSLATVASSNVNAAPTKPSATVAALKPSDKNKPKSGAPSSAPKKQDIVDVPAIPAFAAVPNEFTFSGTEKDLLGMVQGFAKGTQSEGVKPVSPSINGPLGFLSDADLIAMLSQIHVLRARSLSFRSQGDEAYDEALKTPSSPAVTGTMASPPSSLLDSDKTYEREQTRLGEAQKFYAQLFTKQGGKEQLTLQNGKTSIAVYAFEAPRSFALLTRGPSRVIVVRADGLPQLGTLGRLFRQVVGEQ